MYIVGKTQADKQNRVSISGLYRQDQIPTEIVLVIDFEREAIRILEASEAPNFGIRQKINGKPRLFIPKWMMEEAGNNRDFFLIIDGDKKYLSPKTGNVLPKA